MLHLVTLGGIGKEGVDRHPKIGDGVLICAGASVPGRVVGCAGCDQPSASRDQRFGGDR